MIPKICLFALLCALLGALLDGLGFRGKGLFALLCTLLMLISFVNTLGESFGGILSFAQKSGLSEEVSLILRVIGLGYVFGFTSEICLSLGESTIASAVSCVGKVEIFLLAYPYLEKVIEIGAELLG